MTRRVTGSAAGRPFPRPFVWGGAAGLLGLGVVATMALAQPHIHDVEGRWSIQTSDEYRNGGACQLTGVMIVTRDGQGALSCTMKTSHVCETLPTSTARQSCSITTASSSVVVDAQVLQFDSWAGGYCPDNFTLTWVDRGTMTGKAVSCNPALDATLTRIEDLVS